MNGDARGFGRCQSQTPVWGPKDTSAPQHPVIITPHGDVKQHVYFPRSPLLFLSKIYTSSHLLNSVPVTMKFLTLTPVLAVAITLTSASPFPNREKYANAISIVDRKPLLPNHPSPSNMQIHLTSGRGDDKKSSEPKYERFENRMRQSPYFQVERTCMGSMHA
jgi:hypothetical protein